MGMGRRSPYGQQGSFFGGGFSPMFSPMMQRPMYGGPGKGRYPMQPQIMPGGPGKGRSQDPFGRQMQPQPFDQVGNNPPPPPPQLEMVGNNPVSALTGGQDNSTDYSSYLDFYNNRNFQLKPVGNNPPSPPQATTGELPSLLQGPIRQESMTGDQGFGNLQPMPYQPSFGQPMPQPLSGVSGGSFGQLGPTNPMQFPQPQPPAFGVEPILRTQGPMNMPQLPFMGQQGQIFQGLRRNPMDRSAMHLAPQLAFNPRYRRGFYGGGIMDIYPK
tara:strand:+ start:1806 stop:2618 length:813 start_codon:yes stop_codon:yes gene_type:complete